MTPSPYSTLLERQQVFVQRQQEWKDAMVALRATAAQTRSLLAGTTRTVDKPVSKMKRAQMLYAKHKGTRGEMIAIFIRDLGMSVACAKTYCTNVMS